MKVLGLLGGMSWESTAGYYRLLNEGVRARLGGLHSAPLVLWSVDFADIEALQMTGDWDEAGRLLAGAAASLEKAGAGVLVLCTNTMHKVAPAIEAATSVPLVHIVDAIAGAARTAGVGRVGLLGTRFTMEDGFWADRMSGHGIEVVVPEAAGRALVHTVIYEELCRGVFRDESRRQVVEVIDRLLADGAGGVVLGCTEIELLIRPTDTPATLFPSTAVHVQTALDAAMA